MTILKFGGSSMLWQIQTKSPVPPIQSPNPTVTSWSNAAQLVAQIKFDYLSIILSWLDGGAPKTVSGWKVGIGFETVFVPSTNPKLSLFAIWELLDPSLIFPEKKNIESDNEHHEEPKNARKKDDQIEDQNAEAVSYSDETQKTKKYQ